MRHYTPLNVLFFFFLDVHTDLSWNLGGEALRKRTEGVCNSLCNSTRGGGETEIKKKTKTEQNKTWRWSERELVDRRREMSPFGISAKAPERRGGIAPEASQSFRQMKWQRARAPEPDVGLFFLSLPRSPSIFFFIPLQKKELPSGNRKSNN